VLFSALKEFQLDVRGKSVLLKPNLVEHVPGKPVNTHPKLVGAAADCFLRLGAKSVVVAEGPGHERDTELVLSETGFEQEFRDRAISFVDLNRDELVKVKTKADYSGLGHLWLPKTVLNADLVVSMPKVKTHHWAGVTLSMKNMFGIVPGMKYGWPKNHLHWHGIHESILDICATIPIRFVIADGIEAMEGTIWDPIARSPHSSIEKARRLLGYKPRYSSLEAVPRWVCRCGRLGSEWTRCFAPSLAGYGDPARLPKHCRIPGRSERNWNTR
jgi:uncharacterized protein (DUF362 family)